MDEVGVVVSRSIEKKSMISTVYENWWSKERDDICYTLEISKMRVHG